MTRLTSVHITDEDFKLLKQIGGTFGHGIHLVCECIRSDEALAASLIPTSRPQTPILTDEMWDTVLKGKSE